MIQLMNGITIRQLTIAATAAIIVIFGIVIGATSASAQSTDGEITVSPTDSTIEQGESKDIAITYDRLSTATPQGIEYSITYDPAVITITNQENGSYLDGNTFTNDISTPGKVEYAEAIFNGGGVETNSGTVATITVEATSDVDNGATTTLEFTTAKASEGSSEFTITTTNGTVETEAPDPTDGSTDEDSGTEETTDEDSDSEETTDEDTTNEEIAADDSKASDNETTSEEDNPPTTDESTTESELNETENTEPDQSSDTEQAATDSSTNETSTSEDETSGAVPGFGVKLAIASVLAISYIIAHRKY